MSIKTLSTAIALVLAAGTATAQTVTLAETQLAASAGVAPGLYSNAQLVRLIEARRDGDNAQVRFLLGQAGTDASRADTGFATPVATGQSLTQVEQVQLDEARRDDDRQTVGYILSGANRKSANPASVVTPGEAQLAAIAGVDPADYTLAELIALQPATTDF